MKKQEFFIPCEGENLHCIEWIPEDRPRAVLQIVHGMVEYIDRYDDFARYLCSQGIAVVGHDHPGHGKTAAENDLGYIRKEKGSLLLVNCAYSVTKYIKENYPDVKNFILGHSMGSFVVRRYLTAYSDKVAGAVIVGTGTPPGAVLSLGYGLANLLSKLKGERHPSKFLTNLSFSGYNSRFPKEEGEHAWISRDREIVRKYDSDPFCTYTFTVSGFCVLYETLMFLSKKTDFDRIRKDLPVLVTAGGEDPVGSYGKGPRELYELFKDRGVSDAELKLYEGGRHEIINETDRDSVYRDLCDWICARIEA
ncbi:MAG: lysophospholipase [Clostridia bacterium]|nr:lysophospholipase [Clostridia bacterium]